VGLQPRDGGHDLAAILRAVGEGRVKALYVLEDDIAADPAVAEAMDRLEFLVVHSSLETATTRRADVVLPCSTFAEKNGTFTNFAGIVQRIRPSVATLEADRATDGFAQSRLDRFGTQFDRWARGIRRDARPSWKIITGVASLMGAKYRYASADDVFAEIASSIEEFRGMTYLRIGSRGMPLKTRRTASTTVTA
jgi:predicted molibdopterin-dependent oxidoreductase YjgC